MLKEKLKDKRVIYPVLVLVVSVAVMMGLSALKKPPEEKVVDLVAPLVQVRTLDFGPLQLNVMSQGLVSPKYETQLVSQVSGKMIFVAPEFARGGFVKSGQLLAQIEDSDYQSLVLEARAAVLSAQASLQQEEALGAVAADEWAKIKNRKPSALSLRKPQLAQEQARVNAAKAALDRAEKNLERTRIRAPFDALVEARDIGLGTFVNPGASIGKVLSVSLAEIRLPVPDNQLQYLSSQGVGAEVVLSSNFEGKSASWRAKIARSEGVIDRTSRMAYLVAEVHNPYGLDTVNNDGSKLLATTDQPLRFGSYVTAEIKGVELPQAALIPRHLIVENRVALLDGEQKLHYTDVLVMREQGTDAVVVEGLKANDQLIVSALQYPVEGMALRLPVTKTAADEKTDDADGVEVKANASETTDGDSSTGTLANSNG